MGQKGLFGTQRTPLEEMTSHQPFPVSSFQGADPFFFPPPCDALCESSNNISPFYLVFFNRVNLWLHLD